LLTYKSHHEPLDDFAIQELIGHYVSYRKMKENKLLPENDINLYATCVRYPEKLFKTNDYKEIGKGVYEITVLGLKIEIVVLSRIDKEVKNVILNLFSNNTEKVQFAFEADREHVKNVSKIFERLLKKYLMEGFTMPLTIDSYIQEHLEDIVSDIPVDLRLKGLDPEQIKALLEKYKDT